MANSIGSVSSQVSPLLAGSKPLSAPISLGAQYQSLLDANPYRNVEYRESPFQQILSMLGFRTNADAYRENMAVQAKEYDAAIAQKAYDENYDNASAQAERMRAAGINPDINGGQNISPGDAASIQEDPSTPMQSQSDMADFQPVIQFANAAMTALTTGMAIAKDLGSLVSMGITNRAGEIANVRSISEYADWIASNFYASPEHWEGIGYDAETDIPVRNSLTMANDFFHQNSKHIPRRYKRQFERNLMTALNSFKGANTRYDKAVEYLTNKEKYNLLRGRPTFAKGTQDEAVMATLKPLADLSFKVDSITKEFEYNTKKYQVDLFDPDKTKRETGVSLDPTLEADATNTERGYNRDFLSGRNGTLEGEAATESARETGAAARFEREINHAYREIVHNLYTLAQQGNTWAQGQLYAWTIQNLVNKAGFAGMIGQVVSKAF